MVVFSNIFKCQYELLIFYLDCVDNEDCGNSQSCVCFHSAEMRRVRAALIKPPHNVHQTL